jgi:hypothetical protein
MINDTKMQFEQKINQIEQGVFQTINFLLELFRKGGFVDSQVAKLMQRLPVYLTSHRVKLLHQPNMTVEAPKVLINTEALKAGMSQMSEKGSKFASQVSEKTNNFASQVNTAYNKNIATNKSVPLVEETASKPSNKSDSIIILKSSSNSSTKSAPAAVENSITKSPVKGASPAVEVVPQVDGQTNSTSPKRVSKLEPISPSKTDASSPPKLTVAVEKREDDEEPRSKSFPPISPSVKVPPITPSSQDNASSPETPHAEAMVPLTKCSDFLTSILNSYMCNTDTTRAMFLATLTPVHQPPEILHASTFVEGLTGYGTNRDLTESLKTIHPPVLSDSFDFGSEFNVATVVDGVYNLAVSMNTSMAAGTKASQEMAAHITSDPRVSAMSKRVTEIGSTSLAAAQSTVQAIGNLGLMKQFVSRFGSKEVKSVDTDSNGSLHQTEDL